ncbi:MAG: hypothetical protein VW405_03145 [Rhodospirillaceae bacterium]
MATGTIMPSPVFTGLDSNGDPVAGGLLYVYQAGTTTPATTYSDVSLTTPNSNPVVLDSAGRATVYLSPGSSYKFLLKTAASATVWTQDHIAAVPINASSLDIDGVAGETIAEGNVVYLSNGTLGTAGRWYLADADATASSSAARAVGIALVAMTVGDSGSIRMGGLTDAVTGLSAGSSYYISATAGALTTSAPANARFVGIATTASQLLVVPAPWTAPS